MRKFLNRPVVNASLTALGVACGVLIVAYVILIPAEMILASHGFPSPSVIPPPTSRFVVAVVGLGAISCAVLVQKKYVPTRDAFRKSLLIFPAVVVMVASLFVVISKHNEQSYLSVASADFPAVSAATLKDDGHQACDWLRGRHWGTPPELPARREYRFYNAISHGNYDTAPAPTPLVIASTRRLFIFYTRYLRRQESTGVLTPDEKLKRQVTFVAWYRMCPFQQWVHRPVGGRND